MDDMLGPLISRILRTTIVIMVLVQVATILSDKPATSIIAGLGVGGLAIGLAAQDTIKNVFGSLMIFGDRPFELGDTITVDSNTGTVEAVGFRSTRFRTDQGFLISIPNGDLASKSIINISRRRNLVRNFTLPLSPSTTPEKLAEALEIIKQILADHEGMLPSLPPRVTFTDISPAAYSVQVIYWYHPPDTRKFALFGEQVNLQILSRFRDAEISLAGIVPVVAPK
jgi:MscS family membrane protein